MAAIKATIHGDAPVNKGEDRLLHFLAQRLPDDYIVVSNVHLPNRNPRNGAFENHELDAVVIAPHAVYVLENKDFRGKLEGNDHQWYINQRQQRNPVLTCGYKAKVLAAKLREANPGWGKAWCTPVITLSNPNLAPPRLEGDCTAVTFLLDVSLERYLQDETLIPQGYPDKIAALQTDIANFLAGLSKGERPPAPKPFEREYHIEEQRPISALLTEYIVKNTSVETGVRKLIREYAMDVDGLTGEERQVYLKKIQNGYRAVQKIGLHPYVLPVQFQHDDDQGFLWEITDYLDEHSLRQEMARHTFSFREKVEFIRQVAGALKVAHDAGVLHRNISPDSIFLNKGFACLGNFGMAFFTGSGRNEYTVMPSRFSEATLTPYTAPEMEEGDPGRYTDVYGLGLTVYELLVNAAPVKTWHELDHSGGTLPKDKLPSKMQPGLPMWVDEMVANMVVLDVDKRWQGMEEVLDFLESNLATSQAAEQTSADTPPPQNKDRSQRNGDIYAGLVADGYLFIEKIGEGGYSQVWRVRHNIQGQEYAMKVFNESVNAVTVSDEYQALCSLEHSNIVKFIWNGSLSNGRFYTLMEYLAGDTLKDYSFGEKRLSLPNAWYAATQLCDALAYLHEKAQLHRDIKPHNILWHKGENFVLLDFNVATRIADLNRDLVGTNPYIAPDRNDGRMVQWDESCDTFALGVTLYELICRQHPYSNRQPRTTTPQHPKAYAPDISDALADFLFKAVQPRKTERFQHGSEMKEALLCIGPAQIFKEVKPAKSVSLNTEEYVQQLNRLFSQSRVNNSGTRGLDAFAEQTFVETLLEQELKTAIQQGEYKLIIITGNAGDGKTACIQRLEAYAKSFLDKEGFQNLPSKNGAAFTVKGITYQSNYDGSQHEGDRSNDVVLDEFFQPFEHLNDFSKAPEGRIIAINEGRLVDYLQHRREKHGFLEKTADSFFYKSGASDLPPGLLIVNLNWRSIVAADDQGSLFRRQIKKIVEPQHWQGCIGCPAKEKCFIRFNAQSLNDPDQGEEVINRMENLLTTVHMRRELHITMRDMRSFIAFWLTRDHDCEDVKKLSETSVNANDFFEKFYFNICDSKAVDSGNKDRMVKLVRQTDVGLAAVPALDRQLYFQPLQQRDFISFRRRETDVLDWLNRFKVTDIQPGEEETVHIRGFHRLLARLQYFEGRINFLKRNPFRSMSEFRQAVLSPEPEKVEETRRAIATAIAVLEGCPNDDIASKFIVLSVGGKDPYCSSFRLFPLEDFELVEESSPRNQRFMEYHPDKLIFRYKPGPHISLTISLDIYEMLHFLSKGFNPSLNDLKGRFVELLIFKNMLLNVPYRSLLVTDDKQTFYTISANLNNQIIIEKTAFHGNQITQNQSQPS